MGKQAKKRKSWNFHRGKQDERRFERDKLPFFVDTFTLDFNFSLGLSWLEAAGEREIYPIRSCLFSFNCWNYMLRAQTRTTFLCYQGTLSL